MAKNKQKLVIIDSNALIHRAFHALPPLTTKDGKLVNAVYGFTSILLKVIKDLKPDYLVATFDLKGKTFRHEEFEEYKANRIKQPDELYEQIPLVKEVVRILNIAIFEKEGFEADDLIGTIASLKTVDRPDIETIIVTGDQDTFQLVDNNTKVLTPQKGLSETKLYGEAEVEEKFGGLKPKQMIDYKALRGDVSDNIPGVKGIGEKTAIDLLTKFETLEKLYENLDSPEIRDRIKNLLTENKENAFMSKRLATIITDMEIDFDLNNCRFEEIDLDKASPLFQELNFKGLMKQLLTLAPEKPSPIQGGLFDSPPKKKNDSLEKAESLNTPKANPKFSQDYRLIDKENIEEFLSELKKQTEFCFDTETTSIDSFRAKLLGISFSWQAGLAWYLPANIAKPIKKELATIFKDEKILKIGHNLKYDMEVLWEDGYEVNGIYFDTMIASYLLNSGSRQHNLDTAVFVELGYQMQSIEELIGKGKGQLSMENVPVEKVAWYSCEDADMTFRLYLKFKEELKKENFEGLFNNLEMPLLSVLARMEKNGVKIDGELLTDLSEDLTKKIKKIEKEVYKLAEMEFNLASPLQLKQVLFEKMKINGAGLVKTKTGISTGASELEKLSLWLKENREGEEKIKIIDLILEFRELSKLKNTYLDALPKLINPKDGRVHTSFNQTIAATGRLSSSDPNLQNIPIKSEIGQLIRKAFIAEKGFKILKADYSQIELRIVASLANDEKMLEAFKNKADIHTQTAAAINDVKPEEVTSNMRRQAKEVNFGVLYGMGAWGLASRTGISNAEAQDFINKYFEAFTGVRRYLDETVKLARKTGYVETIYGRRRYIPEINSGMAQIKNGAERTAVNMPIQGTAADMIKLAMIEIDKKLKNVSPKSRMILQVHDELVFEVPENEIEKVAGFIEETMCSVMKLRVPIEAEVKFGANWGETEKL